MIKMNNEGISNTNREMNKNQWITFKNSIHVHKKLTYQLGDLFFQRISQNQLNFSHDLKL